MSEPCGCVRASFVVVGEHGPGWLTRCPTHRRVDIQNALITSFADGWQHFEKEGGRPLGTVEAAMAAIERGAIVDRRR